MSLNDKLLKWVADWERAEYKFMFQGKNFHRRKTYWTWMYSKLNKSLNWEKLEKIFNKNLYVNWMNCAVRWWFFDYFSAVANAMSCIAFLLNPIFQRWFGWTWSSRNMNWLRWSCSRCLLTKLTTLLHPFNVKLFFVLKMQRNVSRKTASRTFYF